MNDYRFKIERNGKQWDLYELRPTRGFFKREEWVVIGFATTKETLEDSIKEIVADEQKDETAYYSRNGNRVPNF